MFKRIPYLILSLVLVACTQYNADLQLADRLMESAPDSSLHILQRIPANKIYRSENKALYALLMSHALDKNEIKLQSDSLSAIAASYFGNDDPKRAGYAWFFYARTAQNCGNVKDQASRLLKAQDFSEKSKNLKLCGLVYADIALMYSSQNQYDSSICYYKYTFHSLNPQKDIYNSSLVLLSIGENFRKMEKFDSAMYYFQLAEKYSKKTEDTNILSAIYRNLGSGYFKVKSYEKALEYFSKVPQTGIDLYDSNKWLLVANVYLELGMVDSARVNLKKVRIVKELAPHYYELQMLINEKEKNISNALLFAKRVNSANDSLYEYKLKESFAGLEKKYKYQGLQIANQELEIQNKQKNFYLLLALFVLIAFGLLFTLWRLKVKREELIVQAKLLAVEKSLVKTEKLKFEKEHENNLILEKQAKLQNIVMLNIEHHRKNAIQRPTSASGKADDSKATFYDELIACMDLEYNDISHRLNAQFPSLTQQDILICCLLLAGFDTGMMASVMDVKLDSMRTRRTRLRNKLNLSNADKLVDYLSGF
ncbi:MAG: hypothetical protein PHV20_07585 [Bacteroidales bacterium]|nr:hypothetical protein [Bacteroidales bacterium]